MIEPNNRRDFWIGLVMAPFFALALVGLFIWEVLYHRLIKREY